MYKIELEKDQLRDLFLLREYAGCGPIVLQVKKSVTDFIQKEIQKMGGCTPVELKEIIEKHEQQKKSPPDECFECSSAEDSLIKV